MITFVTGEERIQCAPLMRQLHQNRAKRWSVSDHPLIGGHTRIGDMACHMRDLSVAGHADDLCAEPEPKSKSKSQFGLGPLSQEAAITTLHGQGPAYQSDSPMHTPHGNDLSVDMYDNRLARYVVAFADTGEILASARLLSLGHHTPLSDQIGHVYARDHHESGLFLDYLMVAQPDEPRQKTDVAPDILVKDLLAFVADLCLVERAKALVIDRATSDATVLAAFEDPCVLAGLNARSSHAQQDFLAESAHRSAHGGSRFVSFAVDPAWVARVRQRLGVLGPVDVMTEAQVKTIKGNTTDRRHRATPFLAEDSFAEQQAARRTGQYENLVLGLFDAIDRHNGAECRSLLDHLPTDTDAGE